MSQSRTFKTALLSASQMLATAGWLLTAVILARIFSKEEYATYRQSILVYRFMAPILLLGLPQAVYYFMPNASGQRRNILANNITVLMLLAACFSGFLFFGGRQFLARQFNNPALAQTLFIVAFIPLFVLPFQSGNLMASLMVCNRTRLAAVFTCLSQLLPVVGVIIAVLFVRTPIACVTGYALGAGIMVIPSAWLMYIVIQGGRFRPSRAGIITQLKFAIPLGLSSIAALVNRDLDKVLVSKFCDPELFAVYINGAMQIPMIGILTGSATAVLLPDMRRMVAAGQYGEALTLWKHAAVKCALILLPLMGFLMVMAPDLMTLMFGARYAQSATVFRIYLLLLPIRIAFFGTIFISSGRSNLILIRSIVMLGLNIVLSICLLKLIGYIGAAVATSLLIYIWAIPFNFFWISKIMRTGYGAIFPYLSILKILTAVILAGSALFIAKSFMGSQAVIRTGFCSILYAGLILLLFSSFKLVPLCRMAAIFGGKISNVWKK